MTKDTATKSHDNIYIDREWVQLSGGGDWQLINPATEETFATVALAGVEDVDRAVRATKAVVPAFSTTRKQEHIDLLERIIDLFAVREDVLVHESQIDQVVAFLQAEVNSVGQRSAGFKVHYGTGNQ